MITNKKAWVARDFIIAMLLFSGGIALFVVMVGSISHDYDKSNIIDPAFANNFDKFSDDTARAGEMWNATTSEGGLSLIGTADLLFFSTFRVISLVFESVKAAGSMMFTFPTFFGIDQQVSVIFMTLIFTILTVMIIFIIISSIRSGKEL